MLCDSCRDLVLSCIHSNCSWTCQEVVYKPFFNSLTKTFLFHLSPSGCSDHERAQVVTWNKKSLSPRKPGFGNRMTSVLCLQQKKCSCSKCIQKHYLYLLCFFVLYMGNIPSQQGKSILPFSTNWTLLNEELNWQIHTSTGQYKIEVIHCKGKHYELNYCWFCVKCSILSTYTCTAARSWQLIWEIYKNTSWSRN